MAVPEGVHCGPPVGTVSFLDLLEHFLFFVFYVHCTQEMFLTNYGVCRYSWQSANRLLSEGLKAEVRESENNYISWVPKN